MDIERGLKIWMESWLNRSFKMNPIAKFKKRLIVSTYFLALLENGDVLQRTVYDDGQKSGWSLVQQVKGSSLRFSESLLGRGFEEID